MPQFPASIDHSDEFGISIKIGTFNLRNCALPNFAFYTNQEPYDHAFYIQKRDWMVQQLDAMNADVVVFQEVFQVQALQEVLSVSKTMRHAKLVARDAIRMQPKNELVPQVAIATRLPLLSEANWVSDYAQSITPAGYTEPLTQITRAVPHVKVKLPNGSPLHILGVHLKSKRPDYLSREEDTNPDDMAMGGLRSLMRRGADAVALRHYLNHILKRNHEPCIVAGDFNDHAQSVTTQIIAGAGRYGKSFFDFQLFDAQRIQTRNDPIRNVVYSHIYDGSLDVLDHILVSEEFHPQSRFQMAQVREVYCLNDHLHNRERFASDHGQVVAQLLFKNKV